MDNLLESILKRINPDLTYEELTEEERSTLLTMSESLQKGELTVSSFRDYITQMKFSVENELTKPDLNKNQDLYLKARLRNLLLIESFLLAPEKAKEAVEKAIERMSQGREGKK